MSIFTQATPNLLGSEAREMVDRLQAQGPNGHNSSPAGATEGKAGTAELFQVERLSEKHDLSSFNCGSPILNDFLQRDALASQQQRLSATLVYTSGEIVAAFLTLAADIVPLELDEVAGDLGTKHTQVPAVKICRLARDLRFYKQGLGTLMLHGAVGFAASLAGGELWGLGCRLVVVNARRETLPSLYQPFGFKPFPGSGQEGPRVTVYYDLAGWPAR